MLCEPLSPTFHLWQALSEALTDPEALLAKLEQLAVDATGPAAFRFAVAQLRPKVEPSLKQQKLKWDDIEPVLCELETTDDIIKAST